MAARVPPLIAMRFVALDEDTAMDLATGHRVVVVRRRLDAMASVSWPAAIARLSRLWHPSLAPLLDFGPLSQHEWFEAYRVEALSRVGAWAAGSARRFVREHDVASALAPLRGASGPLIAVCADEGRGPAGPPDGAWPGFGLRLAPRPLIASLAAALDTLRGVGPHLWSIDAPQGSGWSTSWRELARQARQRGFVPVDASVLESAVRTPDGRITSWLALLGATPLLVRFHRRQWTLADRQQLARLLVRLGGMESPATVVLDVVARGRPSPAPHTLGPLGPDALAESLWVPKGACAGQWLRARSLAGACGGWPGSFVARVAARLGCAGDVPTVHERAPAFGAGAAAEDGLPLPDIALDRALDRAAALVGAGRLAAAERRVQAAAHASLRRGDQPGAARRLGAAAWVAAVRGALPRSRALWRQATGRVPAGCAAVLLDPAASVAEQWVRQASLVEAERVLQSAVAASRALELPAPARHAALLVSCLCWQARWDEAADVARRLAPPAARVWPSIERHDLAAAASALHAGRAVAVEAAGGEPAGLRLAIALGAIDTMAAAARTAASAPPGASLADDDRMLLPAEGLVRLGVALEPGVRQSLGRLTRADAPRLARARARLVLALAGGGHDARPALAAETARVARGTGAGALCDGASRVSPWPCNPDDRSVAMIEDLLAVLRACQADEDPRRALAQVCELLRTRLRPTTVVILGSDGTRRTIVAALGRHDLSALSARAADTGQPVSVDGDGASACGIPVHLGSTLVGVVACHWAMPGPGAAAGGRGLLEAVATAMAPTVRLAMELSARPVPRRQDSSLLGDSAVMAALRASVDAAARVPFTVLISGESGSGKELVAREIHTLGPRRKRSFCAVNCAALTDELCEAELFGHARGAFTGAVGERAGLFEEADGGTLFLDEVSELSPRAQAKLLRALQEGEIRRLGETRPRRVDVRVIAATNRPLAEAVAAGAFRADLRYRLDVIHIAVPPLRDRPDDVALLAGHFWARAIERAGVAARLSAETLAALARYDWPGNVRELQNVLAALSVRAPRRGVVPASALPAHLAGGSPHDGLTLEEARRRADERVVRAALARAGGHRGRAATALGVTRQGLAKLVDRLRLEPSASPPRPLT